LRQGCKVLLEIGVKRCKAQSECTSIRSRQVLSTVKRDKHALPCGCNLNFIAIESSKRHYRLMLG
jgi:hypothetical protein